MQGAAIPYVGIFGGKLRRYPGAGFWRNLSDISNLILNLRDIFLIAIGILQSLWILQRFRPEAIFNKVGTAGLPVGIAARILGIPMVLHEPDITPGLGNRILSRWAAAIAVGFPPEHYAAFPQKKLTFTGNPVQPAMLAGSSKHALERLKLSNDLPLVLIVGGSQGAVAVNDAILVALPALLKEAHVYHITGEYDLERVKSEAIAKGTPPTENGYRIDSFLPIDQMADAYAAADLVVARAGANTIAELAALGKAVILVPNHQAAAHQVANAKILFDAHAAVTAPEEGTALLKAMLNLIDLPFERKRLSAAINTFSRPDAAKRIADLVEQVAKR